MKTIDQNDPRITAYALGELHDAELERAIAQDSALRAAVEEIRSMAGLLREELDKEPILLLTAEQRRTIVMGEVKPSFKTWFASLWSLPVPRLAVGLATGMGAVAFIGVWMMQPQQAARPPRYAPIIARAPAPADAPAPAPAPVPVRVAIGSGANEAGIVLRPRVLVSTPVAGIQGTRVSTGEGRSGGLSLSGVDMGTADFAVSGKPIRPLGRYDDITPLNPETFIEAKQVPASSFPVAVDPASYPVLRRFLNRGIHPPTEVVRIEEMLNVFAYDYPLPKGEDPFSVSAEVSETPWNKEHRLIRIGLRSNEAAAAKDVKAQVEFNPAVVSSYRLIGYENGAMQAQPAAIDLKGSYTVTALYELQVAPGAGLSQPKSAPIATISVAYHKLSDDSPGKLSLPVTDDGQKLDAASADFKWAAAVAGFAMLLRDSPYRGSLTADQVLALAQASRGTDETGYRSEFIDLVKKAKSGARGD